MQYPLPGGLYLTHHWGLGLGGLAMLTMTACVECNIT